jgi:hypothetical protein
MSAAVLAAVTGLLGLLVGRLWDARSEAGRWRRDKRAEVYERFGEQFAVFDEMTRSIALSEPGTSSAGSLIENGRMNGIGLDNALFAIWLHGSEKVVGEARVVDDALSQLFIAAQTRRFTGEDWSRNRLEARTAFEGFVQAVRSDLHRSRLQVPMSWSLRQPPQAG